MANTEPLPPGAAPDWTIPQDWVSYTAQEHAMWDRLFARQAEMLPTRVVPAFMEGLDILRMSKPGIPDFDELNERLHRATGILPIADSLLAASSARLSNSIICRNRTSSMMCSGTSRCWRTRFLPIICRLMAKAALEQPSSA
jgi:hypothetical protein